MLIASFANSRIKEIRALRLRKERLRTGRFFSEGIRLTVEASRRQGLVELLVIAPELLREGKGTAVAEDLVAQGVTTLEVSAEVFESLAGKDNPQGIGFVARTQYVDFGSLAPAG